MQLWDPLLALVQLRENTEIKSYIWIYSLSFVKYHLNGRDVLENSSSQPKKKELENE